MGHTVRQKRQLLARARRLKGQVQAVERALLAERGCDEILQQLAAVRGAANGLLATVLEGHVDEHLRSVGRGDKHVLLSVIRRYLK
jgi:DNA-binding FrmR family transcriptional regulator